MTVDVNGNLTQFVTPELCTTELRYGTGYSAHQLMAPIDEDGTRTSFSYDSADWISVVEAPNQGRTTYSFPDLESATITPPNGARTSLTFDSGRRITEVLAPGMNALQAESNSYAATKIVQPTGAVTTYQYDLVDSRVPRMVSEETSEGRVTYIYASTSLKPDAVIDRMGRRTTYTWDADGQKTTIVNPLNEVTTYIYDASSRRIATIDPLGNRTCLL